MKVTPGAQQAVTDTSAQTADGGTAVKDGNPTVTTPKSGPTTASFGFDDVTNVFRGLGHAADHLLGDFVAGALAGAAAAPKPYSGPPIMGKFQTQRFHENFNKLTDNEQKAFTDKLINAGSDTERDYIMKALASNHKLTTVLTFADQIHGKSDEWMHKNLRVTADADNAKGLAQQWDCSCAPTTAEVVRAEMDPIYALTINRKNKDLTAVDPRTGLVDTINSHGGKKVGNHEIADEQRNELEAHGGNAVERGEKGGDGIDTLQALNDETRWTGVTYEDHPVQSVDRRPKLGGAMQQMYDRAANQQLTSTFQKVDADLANGIPCALSITNTKDKGGHAVAITGVTGSGADKTYILHDPWDGKTVYVKASVLESGKLDPKIAGWGEVRRVFTSKQ